ncbi:MAG TPA: beta-ketoacyl-ACP synthase II [Actinomycetota bacterium]|nr:beta-ketoacyl-ACP synthase II [Actinomycetota bacterium]
MTRVFVTGIGVVTPIGIGRDAFWDALVAGRSGAREISAFDTTGFPVRIACEVSDFDPVDYIDPRQVPRMDRFAQMALAASTLALEDAGAGDDIDLDQTGVIVGSGIGGLATIEEQHTALLKGGPRRVSPFMVPRLMPNGAAAAIAMRFGLTGVNYGVVSACATGAHALGEALSTIRAGRAQMMLAGGSEAALTPLSLAAFARMGALSTLNDDPARASRPFDRDRDGFVFGEGAGVLVLESEESVTRRGARVLAELRGYGATSDAFHVTQPDPKGIGATKAMVAAMADADIEPVDVDYVNAHGTSTPFNDRIETLTIKNALGNEAKRVPVTSVKSQTGHLLGAAGAVEAAACVLMMQHETIPATINLTTPDPDCDLDYVPEGPREQPVRVALSNSFGFGGQNACLVLSAAS